MSHNLTTRSFLGEMITTCSAMQEAKPTRPFKGSPEEKEIERALVKMLGGMPYVQPAKKTQKSIKQVALGLMSTALGAPSAGSAALTIANQSVLPNFVQAEFHLSAEEGLKSLLPEIRFKENTLLRKADTTGKHERNPTVPPPNPLSTEGSFWASRLNQRRSGKRAEAPYYTPPENALSPDGTNNVTGKYTPSTSTGRSVGR